MGKCAFCVASGWTVRVTGQLANHQVENDECTGSKPAVRPIFRVHMRHHLLVVGTAFIAGLLAFTSQAQAQNSCAAIQSELRSLNGSGGGQAAQLQQAISQQNRELSRAQNAYQRSGCANGGSGQCTSISSAIGQMQSNLATMQRQLSRAGGGGNQTRVAQLERVFATQCGPNQRQQQVQAVSAPAQGSRSLLSAIFGTRAQPASVTRQSDGSRAVLPSGQQQATRRGFDQPSEPVVRQPNARLRGRTFRTMCVRQTDGFFWPISFSTTRDRFAQDQNMCISMCPGTPVELFAYRNPGEEVDAMLSTVTGQPYTQQDYAFAYRADFNPANRCAPPTAVFAQLRPSSGLIAAEEAEAQGPMVPQPSARPDFNADPQSRVLARGGLTFERLAGLAPAPRGDNQLVRVVGPDYGYFAD